MQAGRTRKVWLGAVALVMTWTACLAGESLAARQPQPSFTAYFSWPDITGTTTVNGISEKIDVKYRDVVENFDVWRASARLEQWPRGSWGYLVDGGYSQAEAFAVEETQGVLGSIDFRHARVEASALYRVGEWGLGGAQRSHTHRSYRGVILDTYLGMRWAYLKQEITEEGQPPVGGTENWFEPLVGARVFLDLTRMLGIRLTTDAGGFGVGSDLTWNLWAEIDFAFSPASSLTFGYLIHDIDYEKGSGAETFGLNAQFKGPTLGFAFRF